MEQRIIPDLHRGIDGDLKISQNVIRWDRMQRQGRGYLLLTVKASPFILNSLIQNESNLPK
jgi:hypothetical protein